MIRLHGVALSGHVHRVDLFLRILGLQFEAVDAPGDVRATPAFRKLNPLGQIPVLEDDGLVLADSNAILVYLAKQYDRGGAWLPEDPACAARVQRWLSLAAGEIAYGPGAARLNQLFGVPLDAAQAKAIAQRLLAFMDDHLSARDYLAAAHPTIADLACYAYVAHAPEGGVSLTPYPAVEAWIARIEALPAFSPMPASAVAA